MAELILVNLITVIVIGAAMIAACRSICRVAPRIRMPTALVGVHVVVVVATVIPSLFGVGGVPYEPLYIPFLLYPGVLLDFANGRFANLFWPWLQDKVGFEHACYLTIVAIPALLTARWSCSLAARCTIASAEAAKAVSRPGAAQCYSYSA